MWVNGKDLYGEYGLRQWNVEMGYANISNASSWDQGALSPLLLRSKAGLKKIRVSVMAKGGSRGEIWEKTGRLVAELMQPSDIELDGFRHHFRVVLVNAAQAEASMNRFHKAVLDLVGYAYGEEESFELEVPEEANSGSGREIKNKGVLHAPLIVTAWNKRGYQGDVALRIDMRREDGTRIEYGKVCFRFVGGEITKAVFNGETGEIKTFCDDKEDETYKFAVYSISGAIMFPPGKASFIAETGDWLASCPRTIDVSYRPIYL